MPVNVLKNLAKSCSESGYKRLPVKSSYSRQPRLHTSLGLPLPLTSGSLPNFFLAPHSLDTNISGGWLLSVPKLLHKLAP